MKKIYMEKHGEILILNVNIKQNNNILKGAD